MWRAIIFLFLGTLPVAAQAVEVVDYAALDAQLNMRADFETLPRRAEPGFNLDALYRHRGLWLGERLDGQVLGQDGDQDVLNGLPRGPVRALPGLAGQNQSVAFHRGFGSNALFPLGRRGFPALAARGEGSVALVFDQDQYAVGLKVHSDYADPLGARASGAGMVTLVLYARSGTVIDQLQVGLQTGINEIALQRAGYRADIAALTIVNSDPGGIAIDDIIYDYRKPLG